MTVDTTFGYEKMTHKRFMSGLHVVEALQRQGYVQEVDYNLISPHIQVVPSPYHFICRRHDSLRAVPLDVLAQKLEADFIPPAACWA